MDIADDQGTKIYSEVEAKEALGAWAQARGTIRETRTLGPKTVARELT